MNSMIVEGGNQFLDGQDEAMTGRKGRRIDLACRMSFFGEQDFEGEAAILDVSTNGCRAASTTKLTVGTPLRLSLFLPDSYEWPLRVEQAIVRWCDGKQFGLEFTDIRPAQRERLRSLIMQAGSRQALAVS